MALTRISSYILANTSVSSGTYGGSSAIPIITVNSEGQITSASNTSIVSVGVANGAIIVNSTTISQNYTFTTGTNGNSVGPVNISPTYNIAIAPGQRWVIT